MIPELRKQFNALFRQEVYDAFVQDINSSLKYPADFKVCETPLFLSRDLNKALLQASDQIFAAMRTPDYLSRLNDAIPEHYVVPNETPQPHFLQADFALCQDDTGNFVPRLIELQGFPSLYGFQAYLDKKIHAHFKIPDGLLHYYSGLDYQTYCQALRNLIIGDADPETAILLEVNPVEQKTKIDFAATEEMIGLTTVGLEEVTLRGRKFYYQRNGREIPIERIYSRVIQDDVKFQALPNKHIFTADVDVKWIGHPNWYYKISKFSLPILAEYQISCVPPCFYVDQLQKYPDDLQNYVLKPLFQYSGMGVELDVTVERLRALPTDQRYILQRKVDYAPVIETPDGYSRAEVRMLYLWPDNQPEPYPVSNLVRTSKGRMMGVRYNANKTWVGSTLAYYAI